MKDQDDVTMSRMPPMLRPSTEEQRKEAAGEGAVVITGANGFLGRACCEAFSAAGYEVRALVRNPDAHPELARVARGGLFRCDLPGTIDEAAFRPPLRALVHCAYTTDAASADHARRVNVEGTDALLRLARQAPARQVVFISSLSAHPDALSVYGRTKLELEGRFTASSDIIIRPGTIIGRGGVFARTREMLRRLPVVPLFYADRALQIIWVGDVCDGILAALRIPAPGRLTLAHPTTVPLGDLYRAIAALDGRTPLLVPFPGGLAIGLTALAEKAGVPLPIHSDNLLGMKCLRWFDPGADLDRLGLRPLSFQDSLARLHA